MYPQDFVMISKSYSDGISVQRDGSLVSKDCKTEMILDCGRSYITGASFVPKWKAEHFVTTLIVGDELTYIEDVTFVKRTVMRDFSESISAFPKEKINRYCSYLYYQPQATSRRYFSGIELLPAQKCIVIQKECEGMSNGVDSMEVEGKGILINGVSDINEMLSEEL